MSSKKGTDNCLKINRLKLRDLFVYHPTTKEETRNKYNVINTASEDFAIALSEVIDDPAELTTLLRKIQEVRMLANHAVTLKSIGCSYRGIYDTQDKL